MLQNYLIIALRNLRNHRIYTSINVLGLGLSVACTVLIFLLVRHHLSYDTYHPKGERTARLVTDIHLQTVTPLTGVPAPMAKAMRAEFSFIEKAVMRAGRSEVLITVPNASGATDKYKEKDKFAFVEPELLDILDIQVLRGDTGALREPKTAMLTEKMARKYFGDSDPITAGADRPLREKIAAGKPETNDYYYLGDIANKGKRWMTADSAWATYTERNAGAYQGYKFRARAQNGLDSLEAKSFLAKPYYDTMLAKMKPEEKEKYKSDVEEALNYLALYYLYNKEAKDLAKAKCYFLKVQALNAGTSITEQVNNTFLKMKELKDLAPGTCD